MHDLYPDEAVEEMIYPKLSISHHVPGSKINTATFSYKSNTPSFLILLDLLVASGGEDG
jgi:hypothetical protein